MFIFSVKKVFCIDICSGSNQTLNTFLVAPGQPSCGQHYKNTPMQYTAIFHGCKNDNFHLKFFDYFHVFAKNIYCGYTLEPPH